MSELKRSIPQRDLIDLSMDDEDMVLIHQSNGIEEPSEIKIHILDLERLINELQYLLNDFDENLASQ